MLQNYTFPAVGRVIQTSGNFIKYERADVGASDETILLRVDGQAIGEYLPGDSITLPFNASNIEVFPKANASGVLRVGMGQIISNRMVMTGTIAVTERRDKTLAANQFIGAPGESSTANAFHVVNPNGKTLTIKKLYVQSNASVAVQIGLCTGGTATAGGIAGRNKRIAGAASTSLYALNILTAAPGTTEVTGWVELARYRTAAGLQLWDLSESPLILEPGRFLGIYQPNAALCGTFFEVQED